MPRHSFQSSPFNIFSTGVYEWIGRINNRHRALTELHLPEDVERELWKRNQIEFICSVLYLQGEPASRDRVERIVASGTAEGTDSQPSLDTRVHELVLALEKVRSRAAGPEPSRNLEVEFLHSLNPANRIPTAEGRPEHSALSLEAACRWFAADSFRELNPVEQAALVFLRLVELKPFANPNEETALLAASLFSMRAGLPPIIFYDDLLDAYRAALKAGAAMNTAPMVELIARSIEATLDRMIAGAKNVNRRQG